MPPTAPAGMACVAVVFARLIDRDGSDRGIKSFIVQLHDGEVMTAGVTCKYVVFDDVLLCQTDLCLPGCFRHVEALVQSITPSLTSTEFASPGLHCLATPKSLPTNMQHSSPPFTAPLSVDWRWPHWHFRLCEHLRILRRAIVCDEQQSMHRATKSLSFRSKPKKYLSCPRWRRPSSCNPFYKRASTNFAMRG